MGDSGTLESFMELELKLSNGEVLSWAVYVFLYLDSEDGSKLAKLRLSSAGCPSLVHYTSVPFYHCYHFSTSVPVPFLLCHYQ